MATRRQEIVQLRPAGRQAMRDADGDRAAVRYASGREPAELPASDLLGQLTALQARKEVAGQGGRSRSRQAITRTFTERLVIEDETVTPSEPAAVSTEPLASLVCRKMLAWAMALTAAVFGTGCLFAIVNSAMPVFFVCLVLGSGFLAGFLTLNGYRHD